jgi:predicted pyridoxine 5'-phosphate oxidase superfamily flavin-nucleotide-binding protein
MSTDPFHEGEIAVQVRAGEREIARHRTIVSSRIVPGALSFLGRQRLIAISAAGEDGHLWTSVWCGHAGFVTSTAGERVRIDRSRLFASPGEPILSRLAMGRDVGMLAIELATRRRLRINGTVEEITATEIAVRVRESVPNCPKYIQRREPRDMPPTSDVASETRGHAIDDERRALLDGVDTAFVGSLHPSRGVDASHRGGAPGFITVVDAKTLRVPDYPGNSMFLTLGNFEIDPRASLAAVDFDRNRVVSFSGLARLAFDVERADHPTGGTGRYWELAVREWVQFDLPATLRWDLLDSSPFNPRAPRK